MNCCVNKPISKAIGLREHKFKDLFAVRQFVAMCVRIDEGIDHVFFGPNEFVQRGKRNRRGQLTVNKQLAEIIFECGAPAECAMEMRHQRV